MRARLLLLLLAMIAALLGMGAAATGNPARSPGPRPAPVQRSADLWATINVCDTPGKPNTIGIRGSMPGLGNRPATLRMRFQVQYQSKTDGRWHNSDESADSGWKTVGQRIRKKVVESGQDFTFVPPGDGGAHVLRGSVRFRWLRKGKVVTRARRFSEGGHLSTAGADPAGYSASMCQIRQP